MAQILFANNAYSALASTLAQGGTTLTVTTGTGGRFPNPTGGDWFLLTLTGVDGNGAESTWEIVKCTARSGDVLTVTRAQESTSAATWSAGTRVEMRLTAGYANDAVAHTINTSNPHSVTAAQVGLGNVTNESKATMFTSPTFTGTPVINTTASVGGTWTAASTWTLPALTLGGKVTLNGKTFSGAATFDNSVTGITDLTTTGNTTLGNASTDTLNVGNGGLVKDASGNVGIGTSSTDGLLTVGGAISTAHSAGAYFQLAYNNSTDSRTWRIANDLEAYGDLNFYQSTTQTGTTFATMLRIDPAGVIDLKKGQIKFPAVQNASADANTLDDYEEGTWTPVLTFIVPGDLSASYSTQEGTYTKIGRTVTVNFVLATSAFTHTTAADYAKITGLPFAAQNGNAQGFGTLMFKGITATNYTQFSVGVAGGTSYAYIYGSAQGQSQLVLDATNFPSGTQKILYGSLTYFV